MGLKQLLLPGVLLLFAIQISFAQSTYWQQAVEYNMNIDFDVKSHRFTGDQSIRYTNNSPDTLHRVFYHLYFNAFQPGSMMDTRSLTIRDADPRVADRIKNLKPNEIGYQKIDALTQDGEATTYEIVGTILEVELAEPILPGTTTELNMKFNAQVPVQIRRSGRDNREGISYSMCQWYPKLAEYDYQGWHANPYIGREFHGIWGDFNVAITIDKDYLVGGSGYLQNEGEIGDTYNDGKPGTATGNTRTFRFFAPQVHDFMWAADPDYKMTTRTRADGTELQFFYQEGDATTENWEALPAIMDRAFDYINEHFGQYPYKKYAFVQGGDGGMEYPMGTLITGERSLSSLVGVSVHELMHSWYQMVLATNESLYAWMDEGFTSYASDEVMNFLRQEGLIPGDPVADPHLGDVSGFLNFVQSGLEEPLSIHSDHFTTNAAYGVGSYVKGAVFLYQLQYILGKDDFDRALLRYYNDWKFKHPTPNDVIRIMEKESGLELDWFKEYFVYTTKLPDYGIAEVSPGKRKATKISLVNEGTMPMPLDITITMKNGDQERYTIPLRIMRGAKTNDGVMTFEAAADWPWTNPTYEVELPVALKRITAIEIDASGRMLDTDRSNNRWEPKDN
ncbi:MAG: M1 family metallopeptidase [Bacteroidota bacterium]